MPTVAVACALLVALTAVLHYEVLRGLNSCLPSLKIPDRFKLLIVIVAAFFAHAVEMLLYGLALYALITFFSAGTLVGQAGSSLASCLYFSAETYTSLGFGDVTPVGPVRLLAGVEALNGLLLIGWSASFIYISMERFWITPADDHRQDREGTK
jgi:ion channel